MNSWIAVAAAAFFMVAAPSVASPGFDRAYAPLVGVSGLQDETFYLFTVLDGSAQARAGLLREPTLKALAAAVRARTATAGQACQDRMANRGTAPPAAPTVCDLNTLRWTAEEQEAAAQAAGRAFDAEPALRTLVARHLRPSGFFSRYESQPDRALFLQAWRDAHGGLDRIIRVYGLGEVPLFADIDSPIYPLKAGYYQGLMANLIRETAIAMPADGPAWDIPMRLAYDLMDFNRRDDAPRQRAIEGRENAATARRIAALRWTDYPYGLILVPGYSPEIAYEPLNPGADLRLRRGVALWKAGKAPLIVVSGASLRPIGTTITEAVEMKQRLMTRYGVPEDAILVDAVARHTTTNMRNTVRFMYRYGVPTEKPALVAGNSVPYIASDLFRERNLRELGYMPFKPLKRPDFDTLEFLAVPEALHRDATDPMDP